ncbi:MAG: hypothetical protein WAqTSA_39170 [Shewanella algae]
MVLRHRFILGSVLFALLVFASSASAADLHDPSGSFTGLLDLVKNSAATWDGKLRGYAVKLFWGLAIIQFIWTFHPLVFRNSDISELTGELVRFIMVIGFFYALLLYSSEWAEKVVDSFRIAGATAAGLSSTQMRPGEVFGMAIELANTIGNVETWNPLTATMVALAGLLVLLCFAFIAAFMGLTIIESYVVINAAVLFMGFGGAQWTREYAVAIVRYAVAVGAKLFILTLIVGLIVDAAKTWQAVYNNDDASMWTMVGLALVCAYLAKTIPELVAGMISGVSMGGGASIGGMAAAGVAGATAAIATIATAGAAAPAAAAAAGAAGAGGNAAGGLASALGASLSGGAPGAASAGSAGASGVGASVGGQTAAKGASSAGSRVGGSNAATQAPGSAPQPSGSVKQAAQAAKQAGDAAAGGEDDKKHQAAPAAGNKGGTEEPNAGPSQEGKGQSDTASSNITGHQIASGAVRAAGIMSAIAVPGMEGAAGLSLGAGAPQPLPSQDETPSDSMAPANAEPGERNIIRPAEPQQAANSPPGQTGSGTKGEGAT